MKAQERHRLKKNELAAWIKDVPAKIEKHQKSISLVLLLAVVIVVAWWLWSYKARAETEQAYAAFNSAVQEGNTQSLATVAVDYAGVHPVAALADYHRGLILLAEAGQRGMVPASKGYYGDKIEEAAEAFQAALDRPYHPVTHPGSQLNLARIACDQEEFDRARSLLNEVLADTRADAMIRQAAGNELSGLPTDKVTFVKAPSTPPAASEMIDVPPMPSRMTDPLEGAFEPGPPAPGSDSPLTDPLTGGARDTGEPE